MKKQVVITAMLLMAVTTAFAQEHRKIVIADGPGFKMTRAFIGAALTSLTPELREFFGAPSDSGVLVASVTENGPAAKAGLRVGDVITAVDGNPLTDGFDIFQIMRGKQAGDNVRLDIVRNKAKQSLVVVPEQREVREFERSFSLSDMQNRLGALDGAEWKALVATPDNDDLRARIRDLEKRLADLEKKMQQK